MATEATARAFFSAPHFAVVGASADPAKFGHKIFAWYINHGLSATPINPTAPQILDIAAVPNLSALANPAETSVSIITPAKITMKVLEEAKKVGVESVWLQPGTFDDEILAFAQKEFKNAVGGKGGRGSEGWCILMDGEVAAKAAGKQLKL